MFRAYIKHQWLGILVELNDMHNYWFFSRPKRQLTQILYALIAFSDCCVGKKWSGNTTMQLKFEDILEDRNIAQHQELRERTNKDGRTGGGARTYFKLLQDLGLIFEEKNSKICHLTLVGESIVKGEISFVDGMRTQLQRYQYPSATSYSGSGKVAWEFKVHPFQFGLKLLTDPELKGYLCVDEIQYIVIFQATSDKKKVYESTKKMILDYRETGKLPKGFEKYQEDTGTKAIKEATGDEKKKLKELKLEKDRYYCVANTFINYLSLTQYIDQVHKGISLRAGKEIDAKKFVQASPQFIRNPENKENYLRAYGRGEAKRDLRNFNKKENAKTKSELEEARISQEYILLGMKTPITDITPDVVTAISNSTGIDEKKVEDYLVKNYPHGNLDNFFLSYREMAQCGKLQATNFEKATAELFSKIFKMKAMHIGQAGSTPTPDVFVESPALKYCGLIDTKAYHGDYKLSGNHKRVMIDEYIPNTPAYCNSKYPLVFFTYIAVSFSKNIDDGIREIYDKTGVHGSAMPVDLLINMAQDYADKGWDHQKFREIFSVNRKVRLSDIQ